MQGLPVMRPAGGWSLLVDGSGLGLTGVDMSRRLFDQARIAADTHERPGRGQRCQFLRLVFANESLERLRGIGARARRAWSI